MWCASQWIDRLLVTKLAVTGRFVLFVASLCVLHSEARET